MPPLGPLLASLVLTLPLLVHCGAGQEAPPPAPAAPAAGAPPAPAKAAPAEGALEEAAPVASSPLHAPYTALLAETVRAGVVDYVALKEREARLDAYLAALEATDPAALDGPGLKAFWINAYNAFTLKLVLERLPGLKSIKDIDSDERWEAERWPVHGRRYSLDAIEHKLLRPLGDARIHFAIVCASRSCPDLLPRAFEPATLDEQLDAAARGFLASTAKGLRFGTEPGALFGENHRLWLSAIFDWFEEDFERDAGSVVDYVLRHAPPEAAAFIRAHRDELSVKSLDYDWALNDR
jgi:hypothetical protein